MRLLQAANEVQIEVEKVRSLYKSVQSKFKYISIKFDSEIKKVESLSTIDINFMQKSWRNRLELPFEYYHEQIEYEQNAMK